MILFNLLVFLVINLIGSVRPSFISDTIIDNEYSELGIMDIKPSKPNKAVVIMKTCDHTVVDDDIQLHLESSICSNDQEVSKYLINQNMLENV